MNASIFAAGPLNLERELQRASTADLIHVDVMDNHSVPNLSRGVHTANRIADASFVPLDVHLMIEHPEQWIEQFAVPNVDVVTFHAEAIAIRSNFPGRFAGLGSRPGWPVAHRPVSMLSRIT